VDADMLNEAACHLMASTALMEDSRMSACISWEAPSLDDSVVEPSGKDGRSAWAMPSLGLAPKRSVP